MANTRLGRISRNNFPSGLERFAKKIHERETLYSQTWTLCPNTVNPGKRVKAYSGVSPSSIHELFTKELEADGLLAGMAFQWMGITKMAPRKTSRIYTISQFPSSSSLFAGVYVPAIPEDKKFPRIKGADIKFLEQDLSFDTIGTRTLLSYPPHPTREQNTLPIVDICKGTGVKVEEPSFGWTPLKGGYLLRLRSPHTLLDDENCETSNNFDKFLSKMEPPLLPCIIKSVKGDVELGNHLKSVKDLFLTSLDVKMNSIGPTLYGFASLFLGKNSN